MVIRALEEHGVRHVFGYPGAAILPLLHELRTNDFITFVLTRHEQGATHAADGYARASGKTGVVLVTSGPGATNTLTGIATAFADSLPLVVFTGQVPTSLIGSQAFQECDIVTMAAPCTKGCFRVDNVRDLPRVLHHAFHLARSGRPGPVLIDLPRDVQEACGTYVSSPSCGAATPSDYDDADSLNRIIDMMRAAQRPLFYTGGGVVRSGPVAVHYLREIVHKTGFPITSSLMGLGAYPATGKGWLGMLGAFGFPGANAAMRQADLILAIGARFGDRTVGRNTLNGNKIIHVDIEASQTGKNAPVSLSIASDCGQVLKALWAKMDEKGYRSNEIALAKWRDSLEFWGKVDPFACDFSEEILTPQHTIGKFAGFSSPLIVTTDIGEHQMWVARRFPFTEAGQLVTSGGHGTMGFGLPAAIGAQIARPDATVLCFSGDGSIQMMSQEMMTAKEQKLPIKVIVLNNQQLGMIHYLQGRQFDGNHFAADFIEQPDFSALAKAYGWHAFNCQTPQELDRAVADMSGLNGPVLLDCRVVSHALCHFGGRNEKIIKGPEKPFGETQGFVCRQGLSA